MKIAYTKIAEGRDAIRDAIFLVADDQQFLKESLQEALKKLAWAEDKILDAILK